MRRSSFNEKVLDIDGTLVGVSLGYDFCAEHEWGVNGIISKFGIDTTKMGVERRKISKGEVFYKEENGVYLLTSYLPYTINKIEDATIMELLPRDLKHFYKDFATAWDDGNFCVVTKDATAGEFLKKLKNEFEKKNILICFISLDGDNLFENSSLSILIKDLIPKLYTDAMYQSDKKYFDLIEYEKKIGVTKLKEKAKEDSTYKGDKYFLACSPKWIDYEDEENRELLKKQYGTEYDIRFWVNYSDDDDNYGWYNAEDIIKWLSTPGLKLKSLNK